MSFFNSLTTEGLVHTAEALLLPLITEDLSLGNPGPRHHRGLPEELPPRLLNLQGESGTGLSRFPSQQDLCAIAHAGSGERQSWPLAKSGKTVPPRFRALPCLRIPESRLAMHAGASSPFAVAQTAAIAGLGQETLMGCQQDAGILLAVAELHALVTL